MAGKWPIGGILALVAATMLSLAGMAEAKAEKRYFIRAGAGEKDAKVSVALSGARVKSGYVLNNSGARCEAFPKSRGFFIDFGGQRVRSGEFRDVDEGGRGAGPLERFRDVVRGMTEGDSVVVKFRSVSIFEDTDGACRESGRYALDQVDRAKWRRYTELAREIDPNFNNDG